MNKKRIIIKVRYTISSIYKRIFILNQSLEESHEIEEETIIKKELENKEYNSQYKEKDINNEKQKLTNLIN